MTVLNTRASVALSKILNTVSNSGGGSISITGASALSAQGGTVTLDSDNVNYTPPAGYIGADTFTVTISDTSGSSINVTLTVNVTDASEGSSSNGSNLASVTAGSDGITLTFYSIPGQSYEIQRSANLSAWVTIATVTDMANGKIQYTDSSPLSSAYYRTATQ